MILNVDKPLKRSVLHLDNNCFSLRRPMGTVWKPHGKIGRDGGSFVVSSEKEALNKLLEEGISHDTFRICSKCTSQL